MFVSASDLLENFPISSRVAYYLKSFLKSISWGAIYIAKQGAHKQMGRILVYFA